MAKGQPQGWDSRPSGTSGVVVTNLEVFLASTYKSILCSQGPTRFH